MSLQPHITLANPERALLAKQYAAWNLFYVSAGKLYKAGFTADTYNKAARKANLVVSPGSPLYFEHWTEVRDWDVVYSLEFFNLTDANLVSKDVLAAELTQFNPQTGEQVQPGDVGADADLTDESLADRYPKYYKRIPPSWKVIDVYGVHSLFPITDFSGCIHHSSKKLLVPGVRTGGKSMRKDILEARDTLNRWLELNPEVADEPINQ